ncbi:MAG: class II aldolase/adducin family protein [Burkholderiales bacterium]|nr:class II aldolase/adducin family protein [Burkholderiales bacterium]
MTRELEPVLQQLVAANRILAREDVVDAFGHVSVRHPHDPKRYIMSCSRSPALVGPDDLMEFEQDGTAVAARGRTPYGERMIHGAVYEARADVHSVVHNHSRAVIPFSITGQPIRPVIHVAGIIGARIPTWDIREEFGDTNLLIMTMAQGRAMARAAENCDCMLMRGHGAVVAGRTLQHAVMRAIYLQLNASLQSEAMRMGEYRGLSDGEVRLTTELQFSPLALDRAWEYFCRRAGVG